ncbi:hypothetical protein GCM10008960_41080 [Deinococcus sedimenti]|uniref:Uncharacterized protein n=1 Tax=Deinococcus sedimenti TaxID=1867090 RepID=A0ABQ2SA46_9DEIO|nr:hypothetical protein GCM10008960_41080 [Deinococcus sedimenti]
MSEERKAIREEIQRDMHERCPAQPVPARTPEQTLQQQADAYVRRREEAAKPQGGTS